MAETKNYVSKYSGDQLDAAIAVLGSLRTMFFSQDDFEDFIRQFNTRMDKLSNDVGAMTSKAETSTNAANEAAAAATNAANEAAAAANAATASLNEIASKQPIIYEEITDK